MSKVEDLANLLLADEGHGGFHLVLLDVQVQVGPIRHRHPEPAFFFHYNVEQKKETWPGNVYLNVATCWDSMWEGEKIKEGHF